MKTLSMREQLDCLIVALEINLKSMKDYMRICTDNMNMVHQDETNPLYIHSHGMEAGAKYCADIMERVLEAAKRQREV